MAFRAVDLYLLTLASWNTDLLSAARAGIDMMRFSLLHHIFFFIKTVPDILCINPDISDFPRNVRKHFWTGFCNKYK